MVALKEQTVSYQELDKKYIWHPFTQFSVWEKHNPLVIERGKGFYLYDEVGNKYLDGHSCIWCNVHGHSHPDLLDALKKQADRLVHSTLLGLSHTSIVELAEELAEVTPGNLNRFFFADSGSNAVEAAIRMAVESSGGKQLLGSLASAYHGDTLGAVGVGYLEAFHRKLDPFIVKAKRVKPPHIYRLYKGHSEEKAEALAMSELEKFFNENELAAFIIEPLVQGAAGIWPHSVSYLNKVRELCTKHGVTLIADEVATGFCKTGQLFACEKAGIEPDLLVMGKGLSGGLLPISAVAAKEEIFEKFIGKTSELKTFFYGQTFAGNPLASSVSVASLKILKEPTFFNSLQERIWYFSDLTKRYLAPLKNVFEVRQNGLMTGLELTRVPSKFVPFEADHLAGVKVTEKARQKGLIIRPLGNVMVLMPAPAMPAEQLEELVIKTAESIEEALG